MWRAHETNVVKTATPTGGGVKLDMRRGTMYNVPAYLILRLVDFAGVLSVLLFSFEEDWVYKFVRLLAVEHVFLLPLANKKTDAKKRPGNVEHKHVVTIVIIASYLTMTRGNMVEEKLDVTRLDDDALRKFD